MVVCTPDTRDTVVRFHSSLLNKPLWLTRSERWSEKPEDVGSIPTEPINGRTIKKNEILIVRL